MLKVVTPKKDNVETTNNETTTNVKLKIMMNQQINGEKYERKWLIYSIELGRVFCFIVSYLM